MNALVAVFITIGVFVVIGIIASIWRKEWGEKGCGWFSLIAFVIAPTPLMIIGAAATSFGLMILAEVLTCIGSWVMTQNKAYGVWVAFVPLLPTVVCLIACIVFNIVAGAVIVVIVGAFQFFTAIGAYS